MQGLRIGESIRATGAHAFDAMVHCADAGRQPEPSRRVYSHGRVEHHGTRDDEWVAEQLLHLAALVGNAGDPTELSTGERRRHGNLSDHRRPARWWTHEPVGTFNRTVIVQRLRYADLVGKAKLDH